MQNKKGQLATGLVTGLVMAIVSLVIAVTIGFIITSTLGDANLISVGPTVTQTVTNETVIIDGTGIAVLSSYTAANKYYTATATVLAINGSIGLEVDNVTLAEGVDYQIFSANGSIGNMSTGVNDQGFRLTYTWSQADNAANNAVNNMTANLTEGIDNVSAKIPTVLLIAAIVLILTVLAILVGVWQKMKLGSNSI